MKLLLVARTKKKTKNAPKKRTQTEENRRRKQKRTGRNNPLPNRKEKGQVKGLLWGGGLPQSRGWVVLTKARAPLPRRGQEKLW